MSQLWTLLQILALGSFAVLLLGAMIRTPGPTGPLLLRSPTALLLAGAVVVLLVLAVPVSFERNDAHDLLECGSVLDPVLWEPSGLPGDRATACAEVFRRRYVWAGIFAALTAVAAAVVALRRGRRA